MLSRRRSLSRRSRASKSSHFRQRHLAAAVEALEMRTLLSHIPFSAAITTNLAYGVRSIAAADFNGDGNQDIVVANGTLGQPHASSISVLLGNGDGTFQSPQTLPTSGGSPIVVATADLNGDGVQDIVTANYNYSLGSAANRTVPAVTQVFKLTVDQPPAITTVNHATFKAAVTGSFKISTTGFTLSAISLIGSSPSGLDLDDNGNGTATLLGTFAAKGTFHLTLSAGNGIGSDAVQLFTLIVV